MLKAKKRFRFTVAILLFQESAKGKTSIVPDDCGWTESNHPSSLLDSPAKIDIVPRFMVFGIEAAHAFKRPAIKRHVTAGNVLGNCIRKQDMTRTAGCRCNTRLNPILCRWCNVRDRKSTRLNSSHVAISYAVFCLKKKK